MVHLNSHIKNVCVPEISFRTYCSHVRRQNRQLSGFGDLELAWMKPMEKPQSISDEIYISSSCLISFAVKKISNTEILVATSKEWEISRKFINRPEPNTPFHNNSNVNWLFKRMEVWVWCVQSSQHHCESTQINTISIKRIICNGHKCNTQSYRIAYWSR